MFENDSSAGDDLGGDDAPGNLLGSINSALAEADPARQPSPRTTRKTENAEENGHGDLRETLQQRSDKLTPEDFLDDETPEATPPVPGVQPMAGDDPNDPAKKPAAAPFNPFAIAREVLGVDVSGKYKSPEDLIRGLAHAQRFVGEKNDKAAWVDELLSNPATQRAVYEKLHAQFGQLPPVTMPGQPAPTAPAPAPTTAQHKGPPKFDPRWKAHYENGQPKPNAHPDVIAAVTEWQEDKRLRDEDPDAWHQKWYAPRYEQMFDQRLQKLTTEQEQRREQERILQSSAEIQRAEIARQQGDAANLLMSPEFHWIFKDANPDSGALSEAGEFFSKALLEAKSPHYNERIAIAELKTRKWLHAQANTNQPPADTRPADTRLDRTPGNHAQQRVQTDEEPTGDLAAMIRRNLRGAAAAT